MAWRSFKVCFVLLAIVVVSGCTTSPTGRSQLMLVSEEEAITMSRKAYLDEISKLDEEGKIVTELFGVASHL